MENHLRSLYLYAAATHAELEIIRGILEEARDATKKHEEALEKYRAESKILLAEETQQLAELAQEVIFSFYQF